MRASIFVLLLFAVFAIVGCFSSDRTPSTYKAAGKVLLPSGSPAYGAEITFVPKLKDGKLSGANGTAVLSKDGAFSLKSLGDKEGVPEGYYEVVINTNSPRKDLLADKQFGIANIPKKYWSEDTTDYFVTIDGDKTDLVIKLAK